METVWDWITVICFSGLVSLMLQRSMEEKVSDHLIQYLAPALGCAASNYVGNHYSDLGAAVILLAVGAYVFYVLKFPAIGPNRAKNDGDR